MQIFKVYVTVSFLTVSTFDTFTSFGWITIKKQKNTFSGMRSSSWLEASAFLRSKHQPEEHKFPYLQLSLFTSHLGNGALIYEMAKKIFNFKDEASIIIQVGYLVFQTFL